MKRPKTDNHIPTLLDVASAAQVSPSTASRVLSSKAGARISQETRRRVFSAARDLNYQPNTNARGLKLGCTFTLAMLIPDVANPLAHEIIKGVDKAASEQDYSVLLSHMEGRKIKDLHIRMVREKRVDGLLLDWAFREDEFIAELVRANIPFMLINRRTVESNRYITTDYAAAARVATEHLIALGHRRIAFLSGPLMSDNALLRMKGYRQSLSTHDIPYDDSLAKEAGMSYEDGRRAAGALLGGARPFTAVFGANVNVTAGAMHELQAAGLRVPDDVSIIACHDTPLAEMIRPRITTVKLPLFELGYETTRALLDMIRTGQEMTPRILPPVGLVLRDSTAEAAGHSKN